MTIIDNQLPLLENLKIEIAGEPAESGEKIDYSKFSFVDGQACDAYLMKVEERQLFIWAKDKEGKSYKTTEMEPGIRFTFFVTDVNGAVAPLSKDVKQKIWAGSDKFPNKSALYKLLKTFAPGQPEEIYKDAAKVENLIRAIGKQAAEKGLRCMVTTKKSKSGFVGIESVISLPAKAQEAPGIIADEIPF